MHKNEHSLDVAYRKTEQLRVPQPEHAWLQPLLQQYFSHMELLLVAHIILTAANDSLVSQYSHSFVIIAPALETQTLKCY